MRPACHMIPHGPSWPHVQFRVEYGCIHLPKFHGFLTPVLILLEELNSCQSLCHSSFWGSNLYMVPRFPSGIMIMFMNGTQSPKVNRNLSSRPGVWSQLDGLQGLQKCRVTKPPEGRNIDIYHVMLWQCLLGWCETDLVVSCDSESFLIQHEDLNVKHLDALFRAVERSLW